MRISPIFRSAALSLILPALSLLAPAHAASYKIDPTHSFIQFRIQHLGYSWMIGTFNRLSGNFAYDPKGAPAAQAISVTVDTASIDTNHAERDKHLRSPDFLDVAKYPQAMFKSTGFAGSEAGGVMTGDLTLHGVTKSIEFKVTKVGEGKDPWGGYRAGFEGKFMLTRKDFAMGYNLGPAAATMEMHLFVEGIRQ